MEELLNEYMELLNKAELNRAVALKLEKDEIAKSQEIKISCYGEFVRRLNEKTGDKYLLAARCQPLHIWALKSATTGHYYLDNRRVTERGEIPTPVMREPGQNPGHAGGQHRKEHRT